MTTKYQLVTATGSTASSIENRLRAMDNDTLLQFYDNAQEWLKQHQNDGASTAEPEKYQKYLTLVQKIEAEGKRREIVPFIPLEVIREIFGVPEENVLN
jgi:ABC-type uncharacterized transport system involved in gliding motility auxiliary subunit